MRVTVDFFRGSLISQPFPSHSFPTLVNPLSLSVHSLHFVKTSEAMAVAQGSKPVKKASAPKKSKTFIPTHPPYIQLITEALVALKERTGSSHYAIAKHIEEQQKVRDLPPNFKKVLSIQLKRFVASGKLVKIKNSFKLPPAAGKTSLATAPAAEKPKPKPKAKERAATKKEAAKPKAKTTPKKKEAAKPKAVSVKQKPKVAAAKPRMKKDKAEKPRSVAKKAESAKAKKSKSVRSPVKKAPAAKRAKK